MELTIERAALARMLTAVSRVVEKRTTIPILSHVLLDAKDGRLGVIGTDMDIELRTSEAATVAQAGRVAVDAVRLGDIAKKVSGETVSMSLSGWHLTVKSGRSRFVLPTLSPDDFPQLSVDGLGAAFEVDLSAMFGLVDFAISTEATRYYLNGIFLRAAEDSLTAVATDGHKLAKHTAPKPDNAGEFGVIVPRKTVGVIPKGAVTVSVSGTKIRFQSGGTVITSKLIDGTFPDYERVIPHANDNALTVGRVDLAKAADRVSSVSEKSSGVKLTITTDNVRIENRSDTGEASEDVPGALSGEDIEIGVNAKYLAEVLGIMTSEQASMIMSDPGSPILFRQPGNDNWLAVVMPMRVAR